MDNKKIDGIKKLSKEERRKSRKIILDLIGENRPSSKLSSNSQSTNKISFSKQEVLPKKKVDNIFKKNDDILKNIKNEKEKWQQEIKKVIKPIDSIHEIKQKSDPNFLADAQINSSISKKPKEEKIVSIFKPKHKQKIKSKKGHKKEEKILKIKKYNSKKEKQIKKDKKKKKAMLKIKKRENQKIKRIELFKKIKRDVSNFYKIIKKNTIVASYFFSIFFLSAFVFYLFFALLLLRFNLDFRLTRNLEKIMPVPAVITSNGLIDYYSYKDQKNSSIKIISLNLTIKKLLKKYNLPIENIFSNKKLMDRLRQRIANDPTINLVGINRIKKIKKMMKKNEDFVRIADKYGDKRMALNLNPKNESLYPFSQEIKKLSIGQISDIITTTDGYYIFRVYGKKGDTINLSYVFIKSKSLEEYLNETATKLKIWKLAN